MEASKEVMKVEDRWAAAAGKMKIAYPKLTDADVKFVTGEEHKLMKNLQKKTGLDRDDLVEWLNTLEGEVKK